ncbi:tetratricopeptide repeat protein [Streptomyces sp. HD]|uniref:tetratricopeptide repeat protein n=1 Tax=Streptomyces sp. HD TaxID=3020892 RepID=UPI00232FFE3E|nr:tetratricopeptide repeat protein [Streptomyces sp. HD]MDC0772227.1 tetratricopeptide repeat protein [Streptomyces sp. HD]
MAEPKLSVQELLARRKRARFVGRGDERAAFRANLDVPPEDERHRFLFHVHGNAGVGKSYLVRELEHIARESGALTAYVDENAGSVPEAMEVICRQFAARGQRFKRLERLLVRFRECRHEAEATLMAALEPEPEGPSAGSTAVARAGLVGLGMVPGVGAFAAALDAGQLARGADRLRAGLSARFGSHEDVQLVLAPESVLTPVLLDELSEAASAKPWTVLFFDGYERTGAVLDDWLYDVMTTDRYGPLPATVVVVTAGQLPLDAARWSALADFMRDVHLGPFTEAETRGLLAEKGVLTEPVVEEVLRLTGGLPVLVSLLAENAPADPAELGDPSATAVEWFLKRVPDRARQAIALACALPRRLNADVFRAVVDCAEEESDALYGWLRGMPFVGERGGRIQYHDVVRAPMLRLQRSESPQTWAERQLRLASAYRDWRTGAEAGRDAEELWADETWRELRLSESYHLLCAGERRALSAVLAEFADACDQGESVAGRWARVLVDAGQDADAEPVAQWGRKLSGALADGGTASALGLLLRWAGYDRGPSAGVQGTGIGGGAVGRGSGAAGRGALASGRGGVVSGNRRPAGGAAGRGRGGSGGPAEIGESGGGATSPAGGTSPGAPGGRVPQRADASPNRHTEHGWSVALAPEAVARVARGRALARGMRGEHRAAVADLNLALRLTPDDARILAVRGEYHRVLRDRASALRDLDRAVELDPAHRFARASRGAVHIARGDFDTALADLDRALELDPDYGWALIRRARVWRELGEQDLRLADLDRALALHPDWAWARCERGDALRGAGRDEDALADYDSALALDPRYASAHASRGACLANLGRHDEALADLDRALDLNPGYPWALRQRAAVHRRLGDTARAAADEERADRLSSVNSS